MYNPSASVNASKSDISHDTNNLSQFHQNINVNEESEISSGCISHTIDFQLNILNEKQEESSLEDEEWIQLEGLKYFTELIAKNDSNQDYNSIMNNLKRIFKRERSMS